MNLRAKHCLQKLITLTACLMFALPIVAQSATGNSVTTVADESGSGKYVATLCPMKDVAIDKNLADVYSIYIDDGMAFLMKMRVQSNRYVLKAGDCAIVKTTVATTIPLEETNKKKSSLFTSDIICPLEDMTEEKFRSSHPVGEGECIYLLTNMASNGGFGLTRFTGDVMRRGNFFIVTTDQSAKAREIRQITREFVRTRVADDEDDGAIVPFLEGEAGNDDGFTAQSAYLDGDANGDGRINVADVVETVNYISGTPTASFVFSAADVNTDGEVNTDDISLIVNIIKVTR